MGVISPTIVQQGLLNQSSAQFIDGSLTFDGSKSQYLTRTPSGIGNQRTWTWSAWIKRSVAPDSVQTEMFSAGTNSANDIDAIEFNTTDVLSINSYDGSTLINYVTDAVFRDLGGWQHLVVAVDTTLSTASQRVRLYVNGVETTDFSTETDPGQDVPFANINSTDPHYIGKFVALGRYLNARLAQVQFVDGQSLGPEYFAFTDPLTNTWRPKKFSGEFATGGDALYKVLYSTGIAGTQDTSSGGGAAAAFDGIMGGSDSDGSYPAAGQTLTWTPANSSLGTTLPYSSTARVYVKVDPNGDDGGLTVVGANGSQTISAGSAGQRYVDISAATSPITSIAWSRAGSGSQGVGLQAVEIDGTILKDFQGKNSFYLPFDGNTPIGVDQSGQGNDWTSVNFSGTFNDPDVLKDSPSGAVFGGPPTSGITTTSSPPSNYATWNPLSAVTNSAGNLSTYANGNLTGTTNNSSTSGGLGTIGVSSGKWYWEITCGAFTGGTGLEIGAAKDNLQWTISSSEGAGTSADAYLYYNDGRKGNNNSASSYGSTYTDGDILGVALDLDVGTISFYKNDVSQGTAFTGLSGIFYPCFSDYNDSGTSSCTANFGQKPFKFTPPNGFQSINVANTRPVNVIARPDQYVGVTTYNGASTTNAITGIGFKPDAVWFKNRTNANSHALFDSVRGKTKLLYPNDTAVEDTVSDFDSFDYDGVTLSGSNNSYNNSSYAYVGWCWKAGGNKNTFNVDDVGYASAAAAGLTAGAITPTGASVGTKQGFSIITYAGHSTDTTLPHGLSQAPDFYILKCLDVGAESWRVYHKSIGATYYLTLNDDAAQDTHPNMFNNTEPTSTVFSAGPGYDGTNNSGRNYISYLWHDVPGLQKFGSYTGNGNADGPFIELGFRPELLIIKRYDTGSSNNWQLTDAKRSPFNVADTILKPDQSVIESTHSDYATDFLSNGFKQRTGHAARNGSGNTYVYMAWAYQPMNNLYGGQSNAR